MRTLPSAFLSNQLLWSSFSCFEYGYAPLNTHNTFWNLDISSNFQADRKCPGVPELPFIPIIQSKCSLTPVFVSNCQHPVLKHVNEHNECRLHLLLFEQAVHVPVLMQRTVKKRFILVPHLLSTHDYGLKYPQGQDFRCSIMQTASLAGTEHDSARGWSARCADIWVRAEKIYSSLHSSCIRSFPINHVRRCLAMWVHFLLLLLLLFCFWR